MRHINATSLSALHYFWCCYEPTAFNAWPIKSITVLYVGQWVSTSVPQRSNFHQFRSVGNCQSSVMRGRKKVPSRSTFGSVTFLCVSAWFALLCHLTRVKRKCGSTHAHAGNIQLHPHGRFKLSLISEYNGFKLAFNGFELHINFECIKSITPYILHIIYLFLLEWSFKKFGYRTPLVETFTDSGVQELFKCVWLNI